jgi:hypothetical protein
MEIDWSKAPEGYPIWIEDLQPDEFADGSGWHRDEGTRYVDRDGLHWNKPERGYYRVHAPTGTVLAQAIEQKRLSTAYAMCAIASTLSNVDAVALYDAGYRLVKP